MEFQLQPNNRAVTQIPSGFSRWRFNFNLTTGQCPRCHRASADGVSNFNLTTGPCPRYHRPSADGASTSTSLRDPGPIGLEPIWHLPGGLELSVRLKLKLHRLKPDGIWSRSSC